MPQKILIVEDEETISSMLKDNLELLGYESIVASSGVEGLRKAEIYKPDLIVLDIMMPGLDGLTVLEKLKVNEKTKEIPVILMSIAYTHEEEGLKLGAAAFFKKPFDFKRLNSKILSLTQRKSVLAVDDNPEVLSMLQIRLNSMGYEVQCASDEKSVMEQIKKRRPDVILMDVVLENSNGIEIINSLKADRETENIPIIAFSGFVGDAIKDKKIAGVEKFLEKEFSVQDLANEVGNIFSSMDNKDPQKEK